MSKFYIGNMAIDDVLDDNDKRELLEEVKLLRERKAVLDWLENKLREINEFHSRVEYELSAYPVMVAAFHKFGCSVTKLITIIRDDFLGKEITAETIAEAKSDCGDVMDIVNRAAIGLFKQN